jgi:hypothetical protein
MSEFTFAVSASIASSPKQGWIERSRVGHAILPGF